MRRLSEADIQKINDFAIESEAGLPPYVLEKDMHVLEAMRAMLTLPDNKHFKLVFCGGTCLSKAYGILERMSEDVDFKVEPTAEGLKLGNTDRRKELSSFGKYGVWDP